jgi:hypothetical protein
MRSIVLGSFLFLLIPKCLSGQDIQHQLNVSIARNEFKARQVIPPAPEAAELGKYGNLPMNLFTGTPSINLPLYELKGQSLSLPISLSFNATGFKPEELASWVGQNWSLNAGGVVTRSVMGNPDNSSNYYSNDSTLKIPPVNDLFAIYDYAKQLQHAELDGQPDYYYYNFLNSTGKYIIRPNSVILKKTKNNLRIVHTGESDPVITDEQGNYFEFLDKEVTSMVLSDEGEPDGPTVMSYSYPSSWYLSKVTSADGNEQLTFEYYTTTGQQPLFQNVKKNESVTLTVTTRGAQTTRASESYIGTPPEIKVLRKFLKRINLIRNGQIIGYVEIVSTNNRSDASFPEDRMVQGINVYSNVNNISQLVKKYVFYSSYYTNPSNTFLKNRLRLDSIKEMAVSGNGSIPPYSFTYNNNGTMPDLSSGGIDHWGFYNGSNNNSLVPNFAFGPETVGKGANRNVNASAAMFTLISQIKYPTGGYTSFEYEANTTAVRANNPFGIVGGIRIKKMTDYSYADKKAVSKSYEYSLGETDPRFPSYDKTTGYIDYNIQVGQTQPASSSKYSVSASSIFGLGSLQGSHVAYQYVTEYINDISNDQPLGKTVYQYHIGNMSEINDDISSGDLEKKTIYNNGGKILQETTNSYAYTDVDAITVLKTSVASGQSSKTIYCKKINTNGFYTYERYSNSDSYSGCLEIRNYSIVLQPILYEITTQDKQLISVTEKTFDQLSNSYLSATQKYTYGNAAHTYPTLVEQTTTNGDKVFTQKKYAADYVVPVTADVVSKGISLLQARNIKGAEIESAQYRQNSDGTNTRYVGGTYSIYSATRPYPISVFRLEIPAPISNFQPTNVTAAGVFTADSRYKRMADFVYNSLGNLSQQTKYNDVPVAYLWDYNSLYTTAEIINGDTAAVAFTSFEADNSDTHWVINGGTVNTTVALTGRKSFNLTTGAAISKTNATATSKSLILSYWSRNGAVTVMQNGSSNIAGTNVGVSVTGWTFFKHTLPVGTQQVKLTAANCNIDELRMYPSDAQMKSFTYVPFTGLSSITAANDLTRYYEYDSLNRLLNTKDWKGQILQNYTYNYGAGVILNAPSVTLYYNQFAQGPFTKNNCTVGEPEIVNYPVPYGTYSSAISQADADTKAQAAIAANGQAYANANGSCWYYNTEVSGTFYKSRCEPGKGDPLPYIYTVEARKYRSVVSQTAANALASEDLRNNGSYLANEYGRCSCDGPTLKMVNGKCETGVKTYTSSMGDGHGGFNCIYVYVWSDGSYSKNYYEHSPTYCDIP